APFAPPPASLPPPEPAADSGQSLVSEAPRRKQGTVALMAGGIAGLIGLGGVAALALGAAWVSGVLNPAEPELTEAIVDEAASPGTDPAAVAGTATTTASGDDAAPPPAADPVEAAAPPATKSSRKSTASEPDAPVRIAPSATPAPGPEPASSGDGTSTAAPAAAPGATPAAEPTPSTAAVETAPAERKTRTITVAADVIGLPVLVDGQKKGVTPLKNLTLSYGFHNVQVDTAAYSADINANTAGTLRYNSALKKWEWLQ
ncbi:MAG: PEGA domain-containing protein, partial [Deltaproteobacteria bacterium]|nr:PEGA domain-containing protein [Deltaproteobacteria bacterium]